MVKMYVTIRLEDTEVGAIDQLIRAGAVKSRSFFIRLGTKMLLSQYTGELDVNSIEKRLRDVESRLNELNAKLHIQNGGKTT